MSKYISSLIVFVIFGIEDDALFKKGGMLWSQKLCVESYVSFRSSVLASPMLDVEHNGRDLKVNILLLAPEIANKSNFCVVEHLTPLKFNLSGTCFTGPVRQTNLALIIMSARSAIELRSLMEHRLNELQEN